MRITIEAENAVSVRAAKELSIEGADGAGAVSPFHLFGAGLAACTLSVLHTWAESAQLDSSDLSVRVAWTFAEEPKRVDGFDMRIAWPSLPEPRREAARQAAEQCTIHHTLARSTRIDTQTD